MFKGLASQKRPSVGRSVSGGDAGGGGRVGLPRTEPRAEGGGPIENGEAIDLLAGVS